MRSASARNRGTVRAREVCCGRDLFLCGRLQHLDAMLVGTGQGSKTSVAVVPHEGGQIASVAIQLVGETEYAAGHWGRRWAVVR